jgi:hypothetical protein
MCWQPAKDLRHMQKHPNESMTDYICNLALHTVTNLTIIGMRLQEFIPNITKLLDSVRVKWVPWTLRTGGCMSGGKSSRGAC